MEARDPKGPQTAFDHAASLAKVRPITEEIARAASKLLATEGLHGHKYAIDAMLAATAHLEHSDVTVVTSDVDDLRRLCHPRIAVEPI
ncbi:type II toxin-antitoxin system VapC family toxin [Kitasatospora sp. A2-31]|uniref:type II toxin-antitoxin system VapC family toxin n=1 Tax=Kitasatospora sp. A2-31 TaxID=2916414 RepID=UPI001EE9DE0A|nr:PIN domain-containing protein [Kitasatospora sp. A2-31]MCG6494811.1 PIN domain-containing protein [Kitasatospora sp. A2-31]